MHARIDKSLLAQLDDGYGTIVVRVVVLERKSTTLPQVDVPVDAAPDEPVFDADKSPVSSYLETPRRGKLCCVFVVNGQRQHAWDNLFIVRDLGLKYLRKRMLVMVDVDGLRDEAIAELMQGTRHGFYEGRLYETLASRVIATLRNDPDLLRLEAEAEEEISDLQTGDEAVKSALDYLIQDHHDQASRTQSGSTQPGAELQGVPVAGDFPHEQGVIVEDDSSRGSSGEGPVLAMFPDVMTIRLRPNQLRRLAFGCRPSEEWRHVDDFSVETDPLVKELAISRELHPTGASVDLRFDEPDGFEEDEYPIETTLRVFGTFIDHRTPRFITRRLIVNRPRERKPRPKPALRDDPTFIRVTSRQPVKFSVDGADVHVKLRWDGKDHLAAGDSPIWTFVSTCTSGSPPWALTFTRPRDGRLELLIHAPADLEIGEELEFAVEAQGPAGKALQTSFSALVPEPREISVTTRGGSQRRPPYELKYVTKDDWDSDTCWDGEAWTQDDAGCFSTPTETTPLTLMINKDMGLLVSYRDSLLERKLAEATIVERTTKYTSHVAFHLYQMHMTMKPTEGPTPGASSEESDEATKYDAMRQEINRVAVTLLKLMEFSR